MSKFTRPSQEGTRNRISPQPEQKAIATKGSCSRAHDSSSKNCMKIPKSVHYELDNALLRLCDVWFEDIKPHLLHNNLKLHVRTPGGGPVCSHLDPGTSAKHCSLCGLLSRTAASLAGVVSAANSVRYVNATNQHHEVPATAAMAIPSAATFRR